LKLSKILFFVLCLVVLGCSKKEYHYSIGVKALPEKLDPRKNSVNIYHYINLAIYYPLFFKDQGHLKSYFLNLDKTKALDTNFIDYQFCLKDDVTFSDGGKVSLADLEETLRDVHETLSELNKIKELKKITSRCLMISLEERDINYFEKLTSVRSTLLKKGTNIGKGYYKILSKQNDKITLVCDGECKAIQKVSFVKKNIDGSEVYHNLDDFNHLWTHFSKKHPKDVLVNYKGIDLVTNRILFVLNKYQNKKLREKITNCLERRTLIEQLDLKVVPINSYLPKGVRGFHEKAWPKVGNCKGIKVDFINFYKDKVKNFDSYFEELEAKTGIKANLKTVTYQNAIERVFSNDEFLIMIMADSMDDNPLDFFTPFFRKPLVVKYPLRSLLKIQENKNYKEEVESKSLKMNKALLESKHVIPIGMPITKFYFKKNLRNIRFADTVNGFIELHNVEVE
jgi:MarR-like DNA-binding transcriptional regulator SgrR of sgrS sRNA